MALRISRRSRRSSYSFERITVYLRVGNAAVAKIKRIVHARINSSSVSPLWAPDCWPSPAAEPLLGICAFFVTFFLVGLWHGQTCALFFGILQGLGVSLTKLCQVLMAKWIGPKQYRPLSHNWLYNTATRNLTFTWFTFTLLWFWSNWMQLGILARSFRPSEIGLVWIAIFLGASVILALWEAIRERALSFQIAGEPLLMSRYVRTTFSTALAVIALVTLMILNAPEPAIVYKAF